MNKTLLLLMVSIFQVQAHASPVQISRVLKDTTTTVALELTDQTVFCTNRGYSQIELKVSVPDLEWLAHFDHKVVGERVPCITGGECSPDLQPTTILDPNETVALAPVRVV